MNDSRNHLEEKTELVLWDDSNKCSIRFRILEKAGAGASAVCYTAMRANGAYGFLKEYYPQKFLPSEFTRKEGDLYCKNGSIAEENYKNGCIRYLGNYRELQKIRNEYNNSQFDAFIPDFEIYRSLPDGSDNIPAVYVFSPGRQTVSFENYLRSLRSHRYTADSVYAIVEAVHTLASCISILHQEGYVHRDLCPDNFGYSLLNGQLMPDTISLYDLDTICSMKMNSKKQEDPEIKRAVLHQGFTEPADGVMKRATAKTDIYSLGAILFYALVDTEVIRKYGHLYRPVFFRNIDGFVDDSAALKQAKVSQKAKDNLKNILKKCLCNKMSRYSCCEDLIEDLDVLLSYLPKQSSSVTFSDEPNAKFIENSLFLHLYRHPLYACQPKPGGSLRIAVIGFDEVSRKFLDLALQSGQVLNETSESSLNVTIYDHQETNAADRLATNLTEYLDGRPALPLFFNVNGSMEQKDDCYGNIDYEKRKLVQKDFDETVHINTDALKEIPEDMNYIFISLGDDTLNLEAAEYLAETHSSCLVSYVQTKQKSTSTAEENIVPLKIGQPDAADEKFLKDIREKAFNAHLVWYKDLEIDFKEERESFRRRYNALSSILFVLSIPYKLWSIGLNPELLTSDPDKAAEIFAQRYKSDRSARDHLLWYEHRRWVVEKITDGYKCMENLPEDDQTKDTRNKYHICIRHSRPDQMLADEWSIADWDTCTEYLNAEHGDEDPRYAAIREKFLKLDELDQMSVKLHALYVQRSRVYIADGFPKERFSEIRKNIHENESSTFNAYYDFYNFLLDAYRNPASMKTEYFKSLYKKFKKELDKISEENRKNTLISDVDMLYRLGYPIVAAYKYENWKSIDAKMTEQIPFSLTYKDTITLAALFNDGLRPDGNISNTAVFSNIGVALAVQPKTVLYLCHLDDENGSDQFIKSLDALLNAAKGVVSVGMHHNLRSNIHFILYGKLNEEDRKILGTKLGGLKQPEKVQVIVKASDLSSAQLKNYIRRAIGRHGSMQYTSTFAKEFWKDIPHFVYDLNTQEFKETYHCTALQYIKMHPHINAQDLFLLHPDVKIQPEERPLFDHDYMDLWNRYSENPAAWKNLVRQLTAYDKGKVLAEFSYPDSMGEELNSYMYTVPIKCEKSFQYLFKILAENKIIERYKLSHTADDGCRFTVWTEQSAESYEDSTDLEINNIIFHAGEIEAAGSLRIISEGNNNGLKVYLKSLDVMNIRIEDPDGSAIKLLDFFRRKNYLRFLSVNRKAKVFSFLYASQEVKELLTDASRILEIYIYHKAKTSGCFDDVSAGFTIKTKDAAYESDCIFTNGYQTLFVKAAGNEIEENLYSQLKELIQKYGVNSHGAIVSDTKDNSLLSKNRRQNISILNNEKEIQNIGQILKQLLDEKNRPDYELSISEDQ